MLTDVRLSVSETFKATAQSGYSIVAIILHLQLIVQAIRAKLWKWTVLPLIV